MYLNRFHTCLDFHVSQIDFTCVYQYTHTYIHTVIHSPILATYIYIHSTYTYQTYHTSYISYIHTSYISYIIHIIHTHIIHHTYHTYHTYTHQGISTMHAYIVIAVIHIKAFQPYTAYIVIVVIHINTYIFTNVIYATNADTHHYYSQT